MYQQEITDSYFQCLLLINKKKWQTFFFLNLPPPKQLHRET